MKLLWKELDPTCENVVAGVSMCMPCTHVLQPKADAQHQSVIRLWKKVLCWESGCAQNSSRVDLLLFDDMRKTERGIASLASIGKCVLSTENQCDWRLTARFFTTPARISWLDGILRVFLRRSYWSQKHRKIDIKRSNQTRLVTRSKESNICTNRKSWKLLDVVKMNRKDHFQPDPSLGRD